MIAHDLPGFLAIYATISEHHGKESLRTCLTDHSSEGYRQRRSIWARLPRETLNTFYTQGFCGVMATVLHQVTGWPIYGVGEQADLARCTFYHVFVRQPDGRYRDVRGPDQSEADMLRAWSHPAAIRCSSLLGPPTGCRSRAIRRSIVSAATSTCRGFFQIFSSRGPMPSPAEATPAPARRPINIGVAIRIARQFNRLSQRDVVRASGISQGVCSEYESGRKHPSPGNLDAVADALHMSPATLYLLAEHLAERDSETPMRHLASIKRWLADTAHVGRKDTP